MQITPESLWHNLTGLHNSWQNKEIILKLNWNFDTLE